MIFARYTHNVNKKCLPGLRESLFIIIRVFTLAGVAYIVNVVFWKCSPSASS